MDKFVPAKPETPLAEHVSVLVTAWSAFAQASSEIAASKRSLYLAYIGEGFTEAQALELCKTP